MGSAGVGPRASSSGAEVWMKRKNKNFRVVE